jgi:hypothetical protein
MREWTGSLALIIAIVCGGPPAAAQPVVVQPKVLERPEPPFPIAAKAAGVEGEAGFRPITGRRLPARMEGIFESTFNLK